MKRTWAIGIFLLLGVISCGGKSPQPANPLKSGFYVADGDLNKSHFPLVVLKVGAKSISSYQLSTLLNVEFGEGMSVDATSNNTYDSISTTLFDVNGQNYNGIVVQSGENLRMRALKTSKIITKAEQIKTSDVLQDYTMKTVSKEKALEVLRNFLPRRGGGYTVDDEAICRAAFDLNCTAVYEP